MESRKHNKQSDVILKAIDYSKFAILRNYHEGDWQESQRILYKDETEKDI